MTPPVKTIIHGAPGTGGWQQHRKRQEDACSACQQARNDYMADYRQRRNPEKAARARNRRLATQRALLQLRDRHRAEYVKLLDAELLRRADERR